MNSRLQRGVRSLNQHLFFNNIVERTYCTCASIETTYFYFLDLWRAKVYYTIIQARRGCGRMVVEFTTTYTIRSVPITTDVVRARGTTLCDKVCQ